MTTTIRDIRQQEFAKIFIEKGMYGNLVLAPRFGKCKVAINIFNELQPKSILISYPDVKIKQSWEDDFEKWGYENDNVTFTTHLSLHKLIENQYDIIVFDEIHLMSENQLMAAKELLSINSVVLGLTGTMTDDTKSDIKYYLGLPILATYSIEKAIEEGVITDYEINIIRTPLDNVIKYCGKKKDRTEKRQFDALTWGIEKNQEEGKDSMFLRFNRMRIIQNSIAKLNKTKQLLRRFEEQRVLVFCGTISMAEKLGISTHHSKSDNAEEFNTFAKGEGDNNHMAVVKIGNSGITYKPLNIVIINYFDSNAENLAQKINRCTAMEYDNPEKKAKIYIICSTEEVELKWLKKALSFFDVTKIKYL